jgi:hypothetical protein
MPSPRKNPCFWIKLEIRYHRGDGRCRAFYVGKGQEDRVFAHIRELADADRKGERDVLGDKLSRIRKIHLAGLQVAHVIHRHGMDERTALEVEAALMDAYPGLASQMDGKGAGYGAMHALEIIRWYAAEPAVFSTKSSLSAWTPLHRRPRYTRRSGTRGR